MSYSCKSYSGNSQIVSQENILYTWHEELGNLNISKMVLIGSFQ